MRPPRHILPMLLVLALVLMVSLGATAGAMAKPVQYVTVTLGLQGAHGLATTCPDSIQMIEGPGGRLAAGGPFGGENPNLQIEGAFTDPDGNLTVLTGCHGDGAWEGREDPYPGQLLITRNVSGDPMDIKFWFDANATKPTKKSDGLQSRYQIVSTVLTTDEYGVTSGVFELWFWTRTPLPGQGNNTCLGSANLQFTLDP